MSRVVRNERLEVRLSSEEKKAINLMAERERVSVGAWVRMACMQAVTGEVVAQVYQEGTEKVRKRAVKTKKRRS